MTKVWPHLPDSINSLILYVFFLSFANFAPGSLASLLFLDQTRYTLILVHFYLFFFFME